MHLRLFFVLKWFRHGDTSRLLVCGIIIWFVMSRVKRRRQHGVIARVRCREVGNGPEGERIETVFE